MAKPIALIKVTPPFFEKTPFYEIQSALSEKMNDYHVLVTPNYNEDATPIELQVFHEKDWTEENQAELKELILNSLPKTNKQ